MDGFLTFILEQWLLVGLLLTLISLLLYTERKRSGQLITPNEVSVLLNAQEGVVLDVRESADFKEGHIHGAINMMHSRVRDRLGELEPYREKPVIVVCKIGQHSAGICRMLLDEGFTSVYRLPGGMSEWTGTQMPVVK